MLLILIIKRNCTKLAEKTSSKVTEDEIKDTSEIFDDFDEDILLPPESDPNFLLQKLEETDIPDEVKTKLREGITGIIMRAQITRESFSMQGMLPPQKLKEFDDALENGAERIFEEIIGQTHHRQYLEKTTVDSNNKQSERGQIFAFILFLLVMIGSFAMILLDKDVAGIAGIIAACGTALGIFIYGKIAQNND